MNLLTTILTSTYLTLIFTVIDHRNHRDHRRYGCIANDSQGVSERSILARSLDEITMRDHYATYCDSSEIQCPIPMTLGSIGYETSDRYRKISKNDTSQGFMQLLNSGNIDGSFTGSFLYFPQINGISLIILHVANIAYLFKKPYKILTRID